MLNEAVVSRAVVAGVCQNPSNDMNLLITKEALSALFPVVLPCWRFQRGVKHVLTAAQAVSLAAALARQPSFSDTLSG